MNSSITNVLDYLQKSPLKDLVDISVTEIDEGLVGAKIELLPYFKRYDGIAHGGFISYLADSVMGFASLTLLPEDQTIFTAEMNVSFLTPGFGKYLTGKARVIKAGKTIHFCEAEIFGERESGEHFLCAKATGTMVVSEKR